MAAADTLASALAQLDAQFVDGDLKKLRNTMKKIEAAHGDAPALQVAKARVQAAEGDLDGAVKALSALSQQAEVRDLASGYLGAIHVAQGRYIEALPLLQKSLNSGVDDAGLHHALGVALGSQARHDEALPHLATAAEHLPTSSPTFFYLGVSLAERGRWNEAADAFARSAKLDARYVDAFEALARVEIERGQVDQALKVLDEGLRHNPEAVALVRLRMQVHADHGQPEQALKALKAIPAAQRDVEDLCNLTLLSLHLDKSAEALKHAEVAVKRGADQARAHYALGLALEAQQPLDRARVIAAYRQSITLGDPGGEAGTRLGFMLLEEAPGASVAEAVKVLEAASTRNQGHPGTLLNLALAQAKAGHADRAKPLCQQILKDPRSSPNLRDQAQRLMQSLGR
ncbi:MAG: tetratricopeptide repeat protein [Pseudomonadota bacterium]